MNKKENILDAWITIEQLSEGSIKKSDKNFKVLHEELEDWNQFFSDFLQEQHKRQFTKKIKKSGVVLYFNIFNFQEIVTILREKYNINATYEETSNSDKFTYCLYFDHELNFIPDKLFLTMSGYIYTQGKFPLNDFLEIEDKLREDLSKKFEDQSFHTVIESLFKEHQVNFDNFRYTYINNLEYADAHLHSFFIGDLQKAKNIETENLKRYLNGYAGKRVNLDSHKDSKRFNPTIFKDLLQPKKYAFGRFPSNPEHALSLLQQTAVNLVLREDLTISSVNGPPGTGKTTLLKDIFADLVVQQASIISQLNDKRIKGSLVYFKQAKIGVLPPSISDKNIVVASSNNGAVQNIVMELPKMQEIDDEFQNLIEDVNYFKDVSNADIEVEFKQDKSGKNRRVVTVEPKEKGNWGVFSLEGGSSSNISKVLDTVEQMVGHLEEEYESTPDVYQEFKENYEELKMERNRIQKYSDQIRPLTQLKLEYSDQIRRFRDSEREKRRELVVLDENVANKIKQLNELQTKLENDLASLNTNITRLDEERKSAERNFSVVKEQKPSLFMFQKLFNPSKVKKYIKQLNDANEHLNDVTDAIKQSISDKENFKKERVRNKENIQQYEMKGENARINFNNWLGDEQERLDRVAQKVADLERLQSKSAIAHLDFDQPYDTIQKSNPWFNKEYRILQSKLFIVALKVRKQFLYENIKSVKAARNIWMRQTENKTKENGQELLLASWQWLNFAIPVISTTFASFGNMFKHLGKNSISNLFIDEAGQALPQASVGGIFRSKNVTVVGDPSQIKPVLTLDSNVLGLIGRNFKVDENYVSGDASTQSIIDRTSKYGFQKNEDEWIGIPLWVHRRSNYPMFTISNTISYDNLMVQGKEEEEAYGRSTWYDIQGQSNDKYVKEHSTLLVKLIKERLQENPELCDEIYVITPFRNVAFKLAKDLDAIKFTKREDGKPTNVGTVHTFQGKEAKIVYFILGADMTEKGSAAWVVSEANMVNVAATRAKEEFFIIGDKKLYGSLGSKVANTTISILEQYN